MANFTDNTTQLQNLLAKVNELPEAQNIDTCTVTIGSGSRETTSRTFYEVAYMTIDGDGNINNIVYNEPFLNTEERTFIVIKNSLMAIRSNLPMNYSDASGLQISGMTLLFHSYNTNESTNVFRIFDNAWWYMTDGVGGGSND